MVAVEKPRNDEDDPAGRLRCGGLDRRCPPAHPRRRGVLAERDGDVLVLRRYATIQTIYVLFFNTPSSILFSEETVFFSNNKST